MEYPHRFILETPQGINGGTRKINLRTLAPGFAMFPLRYEIEIAVLTAKESRFSNRRVVNRVYVGRMLKKRRIGPIGMGRVHRKH
jgi:hypothetical protein